jgi:hypothetical protein
MASPVEVRRAAIAYARRFAWGFENYVGGSGDWRCSATSLRERLGLDDNDDEMAYDDGPCDCPECVGADARAFSTRMPLSVRVALKLGTTEGEVSPPRDTTRPRRSPPRPGGLGLPPDQRALSFLARGPLELRNGRWRFGTTTISDAVVERLLTRHMAIRAGDRIKLPARP